MPPPPTGTVTFLFTDIEGSTRLAQAHAPEWEAARARHHALLHAAFDAQHGYVFQIIGDAFCVAFATAADAVTAAIDAQRALHAAFEPPSRLIIKVRMVLHTGAAEAVGGIYQGYLTLSRVQRIMSAGHGGQVLLSQATVDLVRDHLPPDVTLRDMGLRRLTDLNRPERIFQLIIPGLPHEFAPLKTLDARPNNLPIQATPFIGREADIGALKVLCARPEVRLLTITGVGGTGKTRLALQVAAELLDEFQDGVWLVSLAPIADPALVAPTIASVLNVRESPGRTVLEGLRQFVHDKQLLLVLDNFEHVSAASSVVVELLNGAPGLKVLVTSREVLRVYGERVYPVSPLNVADPRNLPPLQQLAQVEAVRLFIERARATAPDFALRAENAPAIAEICYRLDGLPLAIELAAARVRLLPPGKMLAQMDNRLRFLTGGARDLPARQQTLRATIAWSYELLAEDEKRLFRQLAVFAGGFTLEAADSVCNIDGRLDVLNDMQSLLDKSLLTQTELAGDPRFNLLETVREFAFEQLTQAAELDRIRARHLDFFLALAEETEPHLRAAKQVMWLNRLETEHDNLRAALSWSLTSERYAASGLRMAGALFIFWRSHNRSQEGLQHLLVALAAPDATEPAARAKALRGAMELAYDQSDYVASRALGEASIAEYGSLNPIDRRAIADVNRLLGYIDAEVGAYPAAMKRIEHSLEVMRELNDVVGIADAQRDLGACQLRIGEFEAAAVRLQEALSIYRKVENAHDTPTVLSGLAEIALRQGDYSRSAALEEESLKLRREVGHKWGMAVSLGNLAWILQRQGNLKSAALHLGESLRLRREIGDMGGVAWCLEKMAEVAIAAAQQADPASAAENLRAAVLLLGAAAAVRAPSGSTIDLVDRAAYEQNLRILRSHFEPAAFAALWAEGQAMTLEHAIAAAEHVTASDKPDRPEPLPPRSTPTP